MKTILSLSFVLVSLLSFSQTDEEIHSVAETTCGCLEEKKLDGKDMNMVQMEMGLCIMDALSNEQFDIDVSDIDEMRKFGERVGIVLMTVCPAFVEIIGNMSRENPDELQEIIKDSYGSRMSTTYGDVVSVESDQFVTLVIENEDGKKEKFYWFEHFEGAHLLENNGKKLIGKLVLVEYKTIEYYSPKLEDYTELKVLNNLTTD